ncbi:MAG: hypothetical protein WBO00_08525 [Steroidobacteraceae bacterium]
MTGGDTGTRAAGFAAERAGCATRGDLPDFALAGLAVLARDAAAFALRAPGLAIFRAAGRLGAAFLASGFLVFEAFFAGISFSAPG